jgi:hypothetical protein
MRLFPDQSATIAAWIDLDHLAETGELVFRNVGSRRAGRSARRGCSPPSSAGCCTSTRRRRRRPAHERRRDRRRRRTQHVKSLFGKIRYINQRLDRPASPASAGSASTPSARKGPRSVENLDNGATIYGEGQKDNPFRGFTLDFALVDEAAFVRHGELVFAAIDDACPEGKALVSTVNGDDNIHARIADEQPEGWTYLRLHWSEHPIYAQGLHVAAALELDEHGRAIRGSIAEPGDPDCPLCQGTLAGLDWTPRDTRAHRYPGKLTSPWYEKAISGKTNEQVAREYDIDREGALGARVYDEFQTDRHVVAAGIPYDDALPIELAWDYGLDCTSVVFLQDAPREVRAIALLEMGDLFGTTATPERVAAAVSASARRARRAAACSRRRSGRAASKAIGDPAGDNRQTQTGIGEAEAYRRQGFSIIAPPRHRTRKVETSVTR